MNNNHSFLIALVAIFFLIPSYTFAQGGDPEAVPIDGGLSLLIAAGVGYGIKKAYHYNKQNRKSS